MGNKIIYMVGNGTVTSSQYGGNLVVTADKGYVFGVADKTYLAKEKITSAVSSMGVAARMAKRGILDKLRPKKDVKGFILWADAAAVNSFKNGTDGSATLHIVRGIAKTDSGLGADSVVMYGDSASLFVWPPSEACISVCDRLALSVDDDAMRASLAAAKRAADQTSMANIMSYLDVVEESIDEICRKQQIPLKDIFESVSAYRRSRLERIRDASAMANCPCVSTMAEVDKTTKPCAARPGQFDTKDKPLSKCGRAHRAQEPIDMPTPPQGRRHVDSVKSIPGDRCRFAAAGKLVDKAAKKVAKKVAKKAVKK